MKTITLLSLLVISSCALYKDFEETEFNWLGSGKPRPAKVNASETEEATEVVPTSEAPAVPFEDMISKNWDYSNRIGTYTALTKSADKKSTLMIVKNDQGSYAVGIEVPGRKMSYREGHSVELKIDGETVIHQVESSKDKEAESVRFAEAKALIQKLKGKKQLNVELLTNEGKKNFVFDVIDLQEFFFI